MKRRRLRYALFDLDDTMYPKSAGVMDTVRQRITKYMTLRLGMNQALARQLRARYYEQYGTTLRGLCVELQIDPDDYLSYVHGFPVAEVLAPNSALDQVLACLPWRKVVFTSGSREHAQRVLTALDVKQHFERIFDIRDTRYYCKPHPSAYCAVLDSLDVAAEECLMIDDSISNIRAAKELGMVTVLVGSLDSQEGADFAIDRIEDTVDVARRIARETA